MAKKDEKAPIFDGFGPDGEVLESFTDPNTGITYRSAVEVLPATKRTEVIKQRRKDEVERRREKAKRERMEQEKAEHERRKQRDQEKKKQAHEEAKKREEAKRKREEEEMKKSLAGGLDQILTGLKENTSAPHITFCGITLENVQTRLVANELKNNQSCLSLDLNRKGLDDEDGEYFAKQLEKNKHLQKLELEGNNLGVKAAEAIGQALKNNSTLRSLNLESNNLTAAGNDQKGIIELANALKENRSLRVLMLGKNGITSQAGTYFVEAIKGNETLTLVDLTGNDPSLSVDQLRDIDTQVRKNRERQSAIRRAERRERFALYNEEFKTRQHCMQIEAGRLEIEAHEERRLNRMQARFEKWSESVEQDKDEETKEQERLMEEAVDRAENNKSKGKKKKKGKG